MSKARRLVPARPPWWQRNGRTIVGVLLILAAAYSSGTAYRTGEIAQERADCQAQVNAAFLSALVERDSANRALTDAQRALIMAPSQMENPAARQVANRRYLQALDDQQRARTENPLPEVKPC